LCNLSSDAKSDKFDRFYEQQHMTIYTVYWKQLWMCLTCKLQYTVNVEFVKFLKEISGKEFSIILHSRIYVTLGEVKGSLKFNQMCADDFKLFE
jgi:hypothetical protein